MKNSTSTSSGNNRCPPATGTPLPWGKSDGSSLTTHIRDCLKIFKALKDLIPLLPLAARADKFWDLLFWAVFFHDFGKLHPEFQKVLQKRDNLWEWQRHELYSLPFAALADAGGSQLSSPDIQLIRQAILAHHKDFQALGEKFKEDWLLEMEMDEKRAYRALGHHPEDVAKGLAHMVSAPYFQTFMEEARALAMEYGYTYVQAPADAAVIPGSHPFEAVAKAYKRPDFKADLYWQQMLLWGALKICDHYGSARVKKLYRLEDGHFAFLDTLKSAHGALYSHQEACAATRGNLLLVAPTGSGKTEAAMAWLKTQLGESQGRAYYILPYTASINAMHLRLTEDTGAEGEPVVGVQHGKLLDYLYTSLENQGEVDHSTLQSLADQYRKIISPLKIATPFQILKYAYGVKGFETGLAHLSGAKLIFDEIHAYDARTFAQLLLFLNYLITHLACRVMIMTATLPAFMIKALKETLGIASEVRADNTFLQRGPRHRAVLLEGGIWDHIDKIEAALENPGQKVLVVCNTVVQAQEVYDALSCNLDDKDEGVLLHSRFTSRDRLHREKRIFNDNTRLLVGTQAIEVSLDIDFHVMFTEPAPMDRLLQRFGRINRRYRHLPCPVHVFTRGGENDHWIYSDELVNATLDCLGRVDLIHENEVQAMMDEVYQNDWPEKEKNDYQETVCAFKEAITTLSPFQRHREEEKKFYEQFTGVQVLPASFFNAYRERISQKDFIRADQLLVNLQESGFRKLMANDQISIERIPVIVKEGKAEDHRIPVALCRYDEDLGMTDEFQALYDHKTIFGK